MICWRALCRHDHLNPPLLTTREGRWVTQSRSLRLCVSWSNAGSPRLAGEPNEQRACPRRAGRSPGWGRAIPTTSPRAIRPSPGGKPAASDPVTSTVAPLGLSLIGLRQVDGMTQPEPCQGRAKDERGGRGLHTSPPTNVVRRGAYWQSWPSWRRSGSGSWYLHYSRS